MKILESALNSLLAREETRNRSEVRIFLLTNDPVEDFSNVGTWELLRNYLQKDFSSLTYGKIRVYLQKDSKQDSEKYNL